MYYKIEAILAEKSPRNDPNTPKQKGNIALWQVFGTPDQLRRIASLTDFADQSLCVRQNPAVVVDQHRHAPRLLPGCFGHATSPRASDTIDLGMVRVPTPCDSMEARIQLSILSLAV